MWHSPYSTFKGKFPRTFLAAKQHGVSGDFVYLYKPSLKERQIQIPVNQPIRTNQNSQLWKIQSE